MQESILYSTAAWFALGLIVAVLIFLDQKRHKIKGLVWPIVGFLLSVIGGLLYYSVVMRKRIYTAQEYPAKPHYDAPSYTYEKPQEAAPATEKKEPKQVHQVEGAPRCTNCGTAISAHDLKCPRCGKDLR